MKQLVANFFCVLFLVAFSCFATALKVDKFNVDCLRRHNYYRRLTGKPLLRVEKTATYYAQSYARNLSERCAFEVDTSVPYGQNIAGGNTSCRHVVDSWYGQISEYENGGDKYNRNSGQYTQVVWKSTLFIGCARAPHCKHRSVIVCNYYPPGNVEGDYSGNV